MGTRRYLLVGTVALFLAGSAVGVAWAVSTTDASVKLNVSPSKLPRAKFKAVEVTAQASILNHTNPGTPTAPQTRPEPLKKLFLMFLDNFKFDVRGLATCTADLSGTTTQVALGTCGHAAVGHGSVTACASNGPQAPCFAVAQGVVTAFNGRPRNGPTLTLHVRFGAPFNSTFVSLGLLDRLSSLTKLSFPIPDMGALTLSHVSLSLAKTYTAGGRTHHYVSARCPSGHLLKLKSGFVYRSSTENNDQAADARSCSN